MKVGALSCQHARAVHDFGGGIERSVGGVGVGFATARFSWIWVLRAGVGAQLKDRIDFAGSVRCDVHAFAAGSLAAGIFQSLAARARMLARKASEEAVRLLIIKCPLPEDVDGSFRELVQHAQEFGVAW